MVDKLEKEVVVEELLDQPGCETVINTEELLGEVEEMNLKLDYILDFLEFKFGEITEEELMGEEKNNNGAGFSAPMP